MLNTVGQDRIVVTHEEQWNAAPSCHLTSDLHTAIDGHATLQRHMSCMLDGCSIGQWITERHAQFDNICTTLCCCQDQLDTLPSRWEAAHEIGNKHAAPLLSCSLKGF